MNFDKYSKMKSLLKEKVVGDTFQITEKIHGANFAFYSDGRVAGRNGFKGGDFFNCAGVIARYQKALEGMREAISTGYFDFHAPEFIVYGELTGSQKNMAYEEQDFYVFDIKINGDWCEPEDVVALCDMTGFRHVPVLAEALSYNEMLEFNHIFTSNIGTCEAEGIVIKANEVRCVTKRRTPAFSEKKRTGVKQPRKELEPEQLEMLQALELYVTEIRVDSVVSKFGEPSPKDFGKILGLYVQDVIEDSGLDPDNAVCKRLNGLASRVIRARLYG